MAADDGAGRDLQGSDWRGRVALVTGAARGIGRGIALALAERGADVVLADLGSPPPAERGVSYALSSRSELDDAAEAIGAAGAGRVIAAPCDVTDASAVGALLDRTRTQLGRLDLLVNNAGVVHFDPLVKIDEARWDAVYAVNVKGIFLTCRAAIPLLEAGSSIVNVASVAGKRGYPGGTLYCSSKFAVVGLTQSLAMELAPQGIRVNAICPGILATHMWTEHLASAERGGDEAYRGAVDRLIPLGREQTPADIAQAVLYLAAADNVTGVALNVAGGMEVW